MLALQRAKVRIRAKFLDPQGPELLLDIKRLAPLGLESRARQGVGCRVSGLGCRACYMGIKN